MSKSYPRWVRIASPEQEGDTPQPQNPERVVAIPGGVGIPLPLCPEQLPQNQTVLELVDIHGNNVLVPAQGHPVIQNEHTDITCEGVSTPLMSVSSPMLRGLALPVRALLYRHGSDLSKTNTPGCWLQS